MITLDELIEIYKAREGQQSMFSYGAAREYSTLKYLQELKERRESELKPATKFLNNSKVAQFMHITSEFEEVNNEMFYLFNYENHPKTQLIEELIDLQMSCQTMLAILGLDEQQRRKARKKVIEKNADRGYYEVDK